MLFHAFYLHINYATCFYFDINDEDTHFVVRENYYSLYCELLEISSSYIFAQVVLWSLQIELQSMLVLIGRGSL